MDEVGRKKNFIGAKFFNATEIKLTLIWARVLPDIHCYPQGERCLTKWCVTKKTVGSGSDPSTAPSPGYPEAVPLGLLRLSSLHSRPSTADTEWLLGNPRFTDLFEGEIISWLKRFLRTLVTSEGIKKRPNIITNKCHIWEKIPKTEVAEENCLQTDCYIQIY